MIELHRIRIDHRALPARPRPETEGVLLQAQALDSADCQIVSALATLLVQQQRKQALSYAENLAPRQAEPRHSVENIRRQHDAIRAPR